MRETQEGSLSASSGMAAGLLTKLPPSCTVATNSEQRHSGGDFSGFREGLSLPERYIRAVVVLVLAM